MLHVTDENFQSEIIEKGRVALVDFYADWCGPCRAIAPLIEEIAKEYQDKLTVAKLDVDVNHQQAGKYGVMSIPTLIFFKDGQEVDRMMGLVDKSVITQKLDSYLA